MNITKTLIFAVSAATLSASANAALFNVTINGAVDYNVIQGSMAGITSGAPARLAFTVDSDQTITGSFPTKGYRIIDATFSMTVDGRPFTWDVQNPVYFVLRNNDPAVDGVFLSYGPDLPSTLKIHVPGLTQQYEFNFLHTFNNNLTFNSTEIADAVGTYNLGTNVSVYNWSAGRFGNPFAEYIPATMTIESVPEPATMTILGLGILAAARKRKK